ncbi:MAG TPA: hypothetical protein VG711_02895, partial [Phycisphaerales bacterium]|nr:hypothetical protein [Phycisphaerales bacterium]
QAGLTVPPIPVEVKSLMFCQDENRWAVQVHLSGKAMDFGDRLTISCSQIRLIGTAKGVSEAPVEFPDAWATSQGHFEFDDITNFITSVPGQQQADVTIEFPATSVKSNARFIQIKGTRFKLPPVQQSCDFGVGESSGVDVANLDDSQAREISNDDIRITNRLPVQMSKNQLPSGLTEQGGFLVEGSAEVDKSNNGMISRQLKVEGISEPAGTRVIQVNVSRHSTADIFSRIRQAVPENAQIQLVDNAGNTYLPVGYVYENSNKIMIDLRPGTYIRTYDDLPTPPSAGNQTLNLVFRVTEGVTIVALKVGDKVAGTCNVEVTAKKK